MADLIVQYCFRRNPLPRLLQILQSVRCSGYIDLYDKNPWSLYVWRSYVPTGPVLQSFSLQEIEELKEKILNIF